METKGQHWEKEIREIENENDKVAIVNDKPKPCGDTDCAKCSLRKRKEISGTTCSMALFAKWYAETYIQK